MLSARLGVAHAIWSTETARFLRFCLAAPRIRFRPCPTADTRSADIADRGRLGADAASRHEHERTNGLGWTRRARRHPDVRLQGQSWWPWRLCRGLDGDDDRNDVAIHRANDLDLRCGVGSRS